MFVEGRARCCNMAGVFFDNDIGPELEKIKQLNSWDERLRVHNPPIRQQTEEKIQNQLKMLAMRFGDLLVHRSLIN
jgi:hypothetical protein